MFLLDCGANSIIIITKFISIIYKLLLLFILFTLNKLTKKLYLFI